MLKKTGKKGRRRALDCRGRMVIDMVQSKTEQVERWGIFEIALTGRTDGNPFTDCEIRGRFTHPCQEVEVSGFYDGEGVYKVRFMPSFEGEYRYEIYGNFSDETAAGSFTVTPPTAGNHGPVRVADTYHFAYEDGTPHYSIGTTCYVWHLQSEELQEQTLETLRESAFNKIRFCVFPKHYDYNLSEPFCYPFEGSRESGWDFTRFNPAYFRHLERRIADLQALGIEADIIMLHPYDRWGFSDMGAENDDRYFKYLIARIAAFRNVWWALANEYDLMKAKTVADWERLAGVICENDPYGRLRSIHNCIPFYDHTRPWITHCSLQRQDLHLSTELTADLRTRYKKPIVWDEICYEGNINWCWGNISGQELVRRFWEAAVRGGYAGHGETYLGHDDVLWWSHGGKLYGDCPARLKFLRKIYAEIPGCGLSPMVKRYWYNFDETCGVSKDESYKLYYFSWFRPSFRDFDFGEEKWEVTVLDTWEMTETGLGVQTGKFRVPLPGKEYIAIRLRKISC